MNINQKIHQSVKTNFLLLVEEFRVYHWLKNILLLLPLFLFRDEGSIKVLVTYFFAFSFLASATYVFNDLVDLQFDREHPVKKKRPLASGKISHSFAVLSSLALFGLSVGLTAYVGSKALILLFTYLITTLSYSLRLKRIFVVDIIVLGFLYTLRSASGFILLELHPPISLSLFSFFFFLSLATIKRIKEIQLLGESSLVEIIGRGYTTNDYPLMLKLGQSFSFMAILILFYLSLEEIFIAYVKPYSLLSFLVIMIFWKVRVWRLVKAKEIKVELIRFMLKDPPTLFVVCCSVFIFIYRETI